MKLFLDDIREPPDATWTVVRTADECIRALSTGTVTQLSLDHDLGICDACDGWGDALACTHTGTGYQVCLWMAEFQVWPAFITVHSQNPVGRANMHAIINCYKPVVL